ncbi:hypothetical protein AB7D55_001308 [Vibrio mimicus]
MQPDKLISFIDSFNQPACLISNNGELFYANIIYGKSFHGGRNVNHQNALMDIIETASAPVIKANALLCQCYNQLFWESGDNMVNKEIFNYKAYITFRGKVLIGTDEYMLLIILDDVSFDEKQLIQGDHYFDERKLFRISSHFSDEQLCRINSYFE